MSKTAEIKGVLSLNDSKFVRGIQNAARMGKQLAAQFKANPVKFMATGALLGAEKGLVGLSRAFTATAKTALAAGALASGAMIAVGVKSIQAAADMETLEAGFKTLLGGASQAKERMQDLAKFAADTPFELPEIAEASRVLQVMTKGALAGKKGLTLIGDAVAGVKGDFGELALMIGRVYENLRSGENPSESLRSLQYRGVIDAAEMRRIQGLAGGGLGADAWAETEKALKRFTGQMKEQAKTWNGLVSTFSDDVKTAMRGVGTPMMEGMKPALAELSASIQANGPKFEELGKMLGKGIKWSLSLLPAAANAAGNVKDALNGGAKAGIVDTIERVKDQARGVLGLPQQTRPRWLPPRPSKPEFEMFGPPVPRPTADTQKFLSKMLPSRMRAGGLRGASMITPMEISGGRGLQIKDSPLMNAAQRTTSLLSVGERRAAATAVRIATLAAGGRDPQGKVSRGDRQAVMAFKREQERSKSGIEKTNTILEQIQRRFDELTK